MSFRRGRARSFPKTFHNTLYLITVSQSHAWQIWGSLPSWQNSPFSGNQHAPNPLQRVPGGDSILLATSDSMAWVRHPSQANQTLWPGNPKLGLIHLFVAFESQSMAEKQEKPVHQTNPNQTLCSSALSTTGRPSCRQLYFTLWPKEWRKPSCRERKFKQTHRKEQRWEI